MALGRASQAMPKPRLCRSSLLPGHVAVGVGVDLPEVLGGTGGELRVELAHDVAKPEVRRVSRNFSVDLRDADAVRGARVGSAEDADGVLRLEKASDAQHLRADLALGAEHAGRGCPVDEGKRGKGLRAVAVVGILNCPTRNVANLKRVNANHMSMSSNALGVMLI